MAVHAPAPVPVAPVRVSGDHAPEWPAPGASGAVGAAAGGHSGAAAGAGAGNSGSSYGGVGASPNPSSHSGHSGHNLSSSPPRINPYHLIHHPGSDDPLPPLPPHLARLASGEARTDDEADSDTSDEGDSDTDADDDDDLPFHHQTQHHLRQKMLANQNGNANTAILNINEHAGDGASPKNNMLVSQPPAPAADTLVPNAPAPRRIMKKVSSVFRRADSASKDTKPPRMIVPTPERQRSPMMQGPPPSPPLSDDDDRVGDDASSVAVTETTMDMSEDVFHSPHSEPTHDAPSTPSPTEARMVSSQQLMPVTEAGESTHALTHHDPPPPALQPPQAQPVPTFNLSSSASPSLSPKSVPQPLHRVPSLDAPAPPFLGLQAPRRVSNGSTSSSRAGSLSMVRSGRLAPQREPPSSPGGTRDGLAQYDHSVVEGQGRTSIDTQVARMSFETQRSHTLASPHFENPFPPSTALTPPPRIQRRNTNPSVATQPLLGRSLTQSVSVSAHVPNQASSLDGFSLPADILAQTEILRRERLERRQKKMSLLNSPTMTEPETTKVVEVVAEVSPTRRTATVRRKETDETKVLVGNLVGEGHRNYVLMYNMLTGIRVAVSRCQAKIKRPLTDEDYTARHKYTFDMLGNELTPSARYDFKFKDYAPWVFRELRDEHFHLDPADYLLSLTAKYILSELGSPGKSGSFFYYSRDYRFIIKTISHSEHNFLRSILKDYHDHVRANPHTLLSRFYGLHRVKMPRGRKIHFVIMNNLFPPHRDIHETYDLKGSAFGREYPEDKAKNNPRAVLKDKNWVNRGRTLELGPEKRALLTEQLRRDMEFLKRIHVMDYSLLVGIHNMERGNRDCLRENTLAVFHPHTAPLHRKPSAVKSHAEASNMRRIVVRADPKRLLESQLPQDGSADRKHFLFYQDEGGLRATDEQNNPIDVIYYLGVIDICTPYNTSKRIEHAWKSMTENPDTISCVDPVTYGHRFLDFLMSVMRGGDPALRPPGLGSPTKSAEAHAPPVGHELDQGASPSSTVPPRPQFVEGTMLSSSPVTVPEDEEPELNGIADVALPPSAPVTETITVAVPTVPTEEEAGNRHDAECDDCGDHNRPAIVGHLKTD